MGIDLTNLELHRTFAHNLESALRQRYPLDDIDLADTDRAAFETKELNEAIRRLADGASITLASIRLWLSGDSSLPSAESLVRICQTLRVSADYLLDVTTYLAHGFRWRIPLPDDAGDEPEIRDGIKMFQHTFVDRKPAAAVASHQWQKLCYGFRTAVVSHALVIQEVKRDTVRETQLADRYPHLKNRVFVAELPVLVDDSGFVEGTLVRVEFVAHLAARHIFDKLNLQDSVCGLGGGYSVLRAVELATPSASRFIGTKWLPLMAIAEPERDLYAVSANDSAAVMASRQQRSHALRLPFIPPERRQEMFDVPPTERTLDESQAVTIAYQLRPGSWNDQPIIMSVGGTCPPDEAGPDVAVKAFTSHTLQDVYQKMPDDGEFAGEVLGMMLNHHGELVPEVADYNNRRVYTPLDAQQLRNLATAGVVWVIAAGKHKCEPVRMVLESRIASGLVIDSEIAQYVLDH